MGQDTVPLVRVPNSTIRLPSGPLRSGYLLENALGHLTFRGPLAVASPPGETNRLFVLEQAGRVIVVTNLAAPDQTVFLDISPRVAMLNGELGLLGFAFHPGYATNRSVSFDERFTDAAHRFYRVRIFEP